MEAGRQERQNGERENKRGVIKEDYLHVTSIYTVNNYLQRIDRRDRDSSVLVRQIRQTRK